MEKKPNSNFTFQFQSNTCKYKFESSNLLQTISMIKNMSHTYFPAGLTIRLNLNLPNYHLVHKEYGLVIESPDKYTEVIDQMEMIFFNIARLYRYSVLIDLEPDGKDMRVDIMSTDLKMEPLIASKVTDINKITDPISMFLFVLYQEVIGAPIGRCL